MELGATPYFVWLYTCVSVAALIVPRYPRVAVTLAVACLPAAFLLPLGAGLRAFFGIASLFYHLRVWQMALYPQNYTHLGWDLRLTQTLMFFDLRHARHIDAAHRRRLLREATIEMAFRLAVMAVFVYGCSRLSHFMPPPDAGESLTLADAIRGTPMWLCTLCAWFAMMLGMDPAFRIFFSMFGMETPRLFNNPLGAVSLGEFWGKRWNRAVQPLLSDLIYTPLVSRGIPRAIAVVATFAGSGLLHAYPLVVGSGMAWTGAWACVYFASEGLLMLVERHASRLVWGAHKGDKGKSPREAHLVRSRTARMWRRLRTLLFVVLPSPFLVHPLLHVIMHN